MGRRCGLEITQEEVRYVVLDGPESRPRLVGHGRIPIQAAGSFSIPGRSPSVRGLVEHAGTAGSGPEMEGHGRALVEAMVQMRSESSLGRGRLRAAVATQATVLRVLSLPMMPDEDLELIAAGEADKEQRILGEEMAFGTCPLPGQKGESRRSLLLALTPREGMDEVEAALLQSGGRVESLTTASLAVLTWTRSLAPRASEGSGLALLYLGADRMILTIAGSEGFRQFRDLGLGMNASLLEERRATGTDGGGPDLDWDALDQIGQGLSEVTQVAEQVRQTLIVDERQHPDRPVGKLFLAGDVTRAEAMAPLLENELGLSVQVLDPLEGIELPEGDTGLRAEAASLALPLVLARGETSEGILHLGKPVAPALPWRPFIVPATILALAMLMGAFQAHLQERAAFKEARIDALVQGSTGQTLMDGEAEAWVERNEWAQSAGCTSADPLLWLSARLPAGMHLNRADLRLEDGNWRIDFEARASGREAGSPLQAWPGLRSAWSRETRVMGLEVLPPLGTVSASGAPDVITGVLLLRGER